MQECCIVWRLYIGQMNAFSWNIITHPYPETRTIYLTHWGRVTHICVSELTIIASDNGLSPGRRQAIIWNNAGLLLIQPLGTNFSEISIGIQTFSFKKMHLNMSSAKWRPFCLGLNVLNRRWSKGIVGRLYPVRDSEYHDLSKSKLISFNEFNTKGFTKP